MDFSNFNPKKEIEEAQLKTLAKRDVLLHYIEEVDRIKNHSAGNEIARRYLASIQNSNQSEHYKILEDIEREFAATINRLSLTRRVLQVRQLEQTQECKVYLRKEYEGLAQVGIGTDQQTTITYIKMREIYLREIYVMVQLIMEYKDLYSSNYLRFMDNLQDSLDMFLKQEEDLLFRCLDALIGIDPSWSCFTLPNHFTTVLANQPPISRAIISWSAFKKILEVDVNFVYEFTASKNFFSGELGTYRGVTFYCNPKRDPEKEYIYLLPEYAGEFLIRKDLFVEPVHREILGKPSKGIMFTNIVAPLLYGKARKIEFLNS